MVYEKTKGNMELKHQLHEELIDMVNPIKNIQNRDERIQVENVLCSTGIFTRLMNVFSGFSGMSIKISFEDEIRSTVLTQLNNFLSKESESLRNDIVSELGKENAPTIKEFLENIFNKRGSLERI